MQTKVYNYFSAVAILLLCSHFAAAQNGFRLLTIGFGTTIRCINDNGDAVSGGKYYSYQNDVWTSRESTVSELVSLTNGGQVSGSMPYDTIAGTYQPAYRDASGMWHAIGWFNSTANADDYFTTYKISHNGRFVTGQMSQSNFISSVFKYDAQSSSLQQIATPTNQSIAAYGVNDAGFTVGWYDTEFNGGGTFREACYTDASNAIHFIPTVSGTHTQGTANDISDSNIIVGEMDTTAFIYNVTTNTLQNFAPIGGYTSMSFTAVSNTGVAVGYAQKFGDFGSLIRDAVVYAPQFGTQPRFLKTILEAHGIVVNTPDSLVGTAYTISANGRYIAGWNGPYIFGYGFIIDLQEVLATTPAPKYAALAIAPNPASHYIYLQNIQKFIDLGTTQPAAFKISDILGKTVLTKPITDFNAPINIGDLPSGVYITSLKIGQQEFSTKLMVE